MSRGKVQLYSVSFDPDALVISYIRLPEDLRAGGKVMVQHQVRLDISHPDYGDDARLLHELAVRALESALEDFESSEPFTPDDDDADDDRGMGEH